MNRYEVHQIEPGPAPLLLVGGDPVPPSGLDGLQPQQAVHRAAERAAAGLADVDPHLLAVQVAAGLAAAGRVGVQAAAALLTRGELHLVHLVAQPSW
ncbi:MAG: hypothetical protein ACRDTE_22865 [Pseudonocardiaceae bacterium]